jgi:hypothetical protein
LKKEVEDVRFDKEREVTALQTSLNQLQLELNEVKLRNVVNHSDISGSTSQTITLDGSRGSSSKQ